MKFLFKYPSRGRKDLFKSTFSKWTNMLSGKHSYEFLVSLDQNDRHMNNTEMHDFLDSQKNTTYCYSNNTSKIEAINVNMESAIDNNWEILILISDDMIPQIQGYDDIIATKMKETYPDLDGALWFNDGRAKEALCTLSIMGKKLYDRFGYIYHPQYKSLWCDNEYHEVCHQWGKITYIDQVIIKHDWVDVTGQDSLHTRNESFHDKDKRVFNSRKAAGFPKEHVEVKEKPSDQRRREYSSRRRGS